MKLISDIINELMNIDQSLSGPLLKTKVLATRIDNTALLLWVNGELNGYADTTNLPEYRVSSGSLFGTYQNGAGLYKNVAIPIPNIANDIYTKIVKTTVNDGVSALEKLSGQSNLGMAVNDATKSLLEYETRAAGNHYYQILNIHLKFSTTLFENILSTVRSKLLEFMLELEKQFGEETKIEDLKTQNTAITHIMNTTINNHGDANVINTGSDATINTNNQISKGNKDILTDTLKKNGVADEDIRELLSVVDEKKTNISDQYNPSVKNWMAKMFSKALDSSWQIGIGTAGGVLADALAVHYGLK